MDGFRDSVAIVTGAASGIGLQLSRQLREAGATVVMADLNDAAVAKAAAELGAAADGDASVHAVGLDVTDRDAVFRVVNETIEEHGRLDYLFNNAGIGVGGETFDFEHDDWKRVIDVNLYGVIHGVEAAYPLMKERGAGHIVNTASVAGLLPVPGEISYTAAKHAVVGLGQALRAEAADFGVRVTTICPGVIATPIYETSKLVGFERERVFAMWPEGVSAERCAREILQGVARNRSVVVITTSGRLMVLAQRLFPWAVAFVGRHYMRRMRREARAS